MSITDFIEFLHQGQSRKTGEKFTMHLYAVKNLLEQGGVKEKSILNAALLHDSLENSQITKDYLTLKFGKKVATIVDIVSKKPAWKTSYCKMKSNLDEIERSWNDHPEAVLIKMADRLHNLRTIEGFSKVKQKEYLEETKCFLIPLFKRVLKRDRLGYLKKYMESFLRKLSREIRSIEKRLSIR